MEIADAVQGFVDLGLVAVNGRTIFNTIMDTRQKYTSTGTLYVLGFDITVTFNEPKDYLFTTRTTTISFTSSAHIRFVGFNDARKRIAALEHEGAYLLGDTPGGLVRTAEMAFNFFSGDAVLGD